MLYLSLSQSPPPTILRKAFGDACTLSLLTLTRDDVREEWTLMFTWVLRLPAFVSRCQFKDIDHRVSSDTGTQSAAARLQSVLGYGQSQFKVLDAHLSPIGSLPLT